MDLYFAYGSNMNKEQMEKRCPNAQLLGTAIALDKKLAFTIYSKKRQSGCADIIPSKNSSVYGLLYKIDSKELNRLDKFEGTPTHYRRIPITVTYKNNLVEAQTYEVTEKIEGFDPSESYMRLLEEAAKINEFPNKYQMFLKGIRRIEII